MKTAIHVCILLVLSAVFSLGRAGDITTVCAPRAEPDRANGETFEMNALAPCSPHD